MSELIVKARGLSKYYDQQRTCALDSVDVDVSRGEWLAIMGPSGSGKSTLLNILACLDRPTNGSLIMDGVQMDTLSETQLTTFRRDCIGLVFQQFHLVSYLNAVENVMLSQYFHSVVDEDEAKQALREVGLGERLRHLPCQLSGGEQQRVCIARALINQPKIVLADEPTGNLDQQNEDLVMDIFKTLHEKGSTIIMVTHDPDVAAMADRLIKLSHGKIVESARNGKAAGPAHAVAASVC
ncbi:MAG: ABC transporter ATP-binding protein [Dehalococcoidia bacterium]|nr:ABC transporter ATP-binding protein [Dehalococcoidia bacterium]